MSCCGSLAGTYLLEDAGEGLCNRRSGGSGYGHLAGEPGDHRCSIYLQPVYCNRKYGEDQESTDRGVERPENPASVDWMGIRRIPGRYGRIWNGGCDSGRNPVWTWFFTGSCDGCMSGGECNTDSVWFRRYPDGNTGAADGNSTGKSCMGHGGSVIATDLDHTFCDGDH